jgi:hypothetical protein
MAQHSRSAFYFLPVSDIVDPWHHVSTSAQGSPYLLLLVAKSALTLQKSGYRSRNWPNRPINRSGMRGRICRLIGFFIYRFSAKIARFLIKFVWKSWIFKKNRPIYRWNRPNFGLSKFYCSSCHIRSISAYFSWILSIFFLNFQKINWIFPPLPNFRTLTGSSAE